MWAELTAAALVPGVGEARVRPTAGQRMLADPAAIAPPQAKDFLSIGSSARGVRLTL
jgi:hypothetical protein